MNRTQKGACFTLGMAVLFLALMGIVHASMFAPEDSIAVLVQYGRPKKGEES